MRSAALPLCALLATAWACRARPEEQPVRELFDLARQAEPEEARLAALFDLEAGRSAELYDALDRLPAARRLEFRRVDRLDPLGRVVVEVTCALEGGAEASFTVQLEPDAAGRLRIGAFDGPGVSWPARKRPAGSGLSTWPEP